MRICSVSGCDAKHFAKGMCRNHYNKKRLIDVPGLREKKRLMSLEWVRSPRGREMQRERMLLSRRGITVKEFNVMLHSQDGKCCVCGVSQADVKEHFSVDHDHTCCVGENSCGQCIRGLLCNRCNSGLGHFNDSKELLRSAADYLEKYDMKKTGV